MTLTPETVRHAKEADRLGTPTKLLPKSFSKKLLFVGTEFVKRTPALVGSICMPKPENKSICRNKFFSSLHR